VRYETTEKESESETFRRSLFVVEDVEEGDPFTEENVRSIRPGDGLKPKNEDTIRGRVASQDIERGTPLRWTHVRDH
jgi:sialic acid synthase SpsE